MPSKLDQLKAMTVVVADTGDIDAIRKFKPVDCTTNPSLILKAVQSDSEAIHELVDEAVVWGRSHNKATSVIADRVVINVGAELTRLVPGRVSTEVNADLSFDTKGTIAKARAIIAERYAIPKDLRARRRTTDTARTDRRSKESPSAPSTGPSTPNATTTTAA